MEMKDKIEKISSVVPSKIQEVKETLQGWSDVKLIIIIILIWGLLYIPTAFSNSIGGKDRHFAYYPEGAGPEDITYKDYNVSTRPVPLRNSSDGRFFLDVEKGEIREFDWTAEKYDSSRHIGRVNVYYEYNNSKDNKERIRLENIERDGVNTNWAGDHRFKKNGTISYYYRVDKNDIPVFHRRASVILEGGNLYEDVRTGPPPLINFFFLPPTLLTPAISLGGAYLSFQIYFSLFVLIDTLILYFGFKDFYKPEAFLAGLLFLCNPVTVSNIHQDEAIMAFVILLPAYFLIKERENISSIMTGFSVPVKVWGLFLYPLYLIRKDRDWKKGLKSILTALSVSFFIFIFFYFLWGDKSIWFLSQYSGQNRGIGLGPVSFWGRWWAVFPNAKQIISREIILAIISVLEFVTFLVAYKRRWTRVASLTAFLSIFFALYIKVHWSYFIILFPFLAWFAVLDKRAFFSYIALVGILWTMMILASSSFSAGAIGMALLATGIRAILFLNIVLFFISESSFKLEGERYRDRPKLEDEYGG